MPEPRKRRVFTILALASLSIFDSYAQGLKIGDRIPDVQLPDQSGVMRSYPSLRGPKGAMLVFYQSADWCTFCKSQLVDLERSSDDLKKQGLGLAAISYDSVATLKFFADRKSIHFPLLSDEASTVIRAFGILNEQVPQTSEFHGIALPVTYIVDENGIVRSRNFDDDFRRRYTVGNLLDRRTDASAIEAKHLAITRSASDSVAYGGQRIKLFLELQLPSKSHVYAPGVQGYIPIEWKLKPSDSYEALPFEYPASRNLHLKAIGETVPVYEGKLVLEREIIPAQKTAEREIRIEGELRYQVCDDKQCFVPETVPLLWSLRYEPHDTTRAPVETRRKRR